MRHLLACLVIATSPTETHCQEIEFDQGTWSTPDLTKQIRQHISFANEERIDSIYVEDIGSGAMELVVQRYPLARYEYYIGSGEDQPLHRRIDIRQIEVLDTLFTEDIQTGQLEMVIQKFIKDIPNGAYHEFFPNGNIRIKGTLDGYNADGTLKKTGEWKEWDTNGTVIRQESYP